MNQPRSRGFSARFLPSGRAMETRLKYLGVVLSCAKTIMVLFKGIYGACAVVGIKKR